jgi:hypothetical protein
MSTETPDNSTDTGEAPTVRQQIRAYYLRMRRAGATVPRARELALSRYQSTPSAGEILADIIETLDEE